MLKNWQFDVLFWTGVGGAIFLLFAPALGLEISPVSVTPLGMILTYLLTQKTNIVKDKDKDKDKDDDGKHRRRATGGES